MEIFKFHDLIHFLSYCFIRSLVQNIGTIIHVKLLLVVIFLLDMTHLWISVAAYLRLCNYSHFAVIPAITILELSSLNGSRSEGLLLRLNDTPLIVL